MKGQEISNTKSAWDLKMENSKRIKNATERSDKSIRCFKSEVNTADITFKFI
jgi:hypothetical protein